MAAVHASEANQMKVWSAVIGFASDNCNVMIGAHNSVLSRVKEQQPNVFCICHLANLCVAAGIKAQGRVDICRRLLCRDLLPLRQEVSSQIILCFLYTLK